MCLLQIKLYVNGMLYSILTVPSIRCDARTMVSEVLSALAHAVKTVIYVHMIIDYLDIVLICVIFFVIIHVIIFMLLVAD